jgi:hypothetical protein
MSKAQPIQKKVKSKPMSAAERANFEMILPHHKTEVGAITNISSNRASLCNFLSTHL